MQGLQTRQAQGLPASQWAPLPAKKGLPNLFQPQHGPPLPFSCLPSSHSWEGCGEKRPQGAGKTWAAEPGVLCGVGLNWCSPSCPNSSIVPLPMPGSLDPPLRLPPAPPLSLSVPDLHPRSALAAGRTRPRALGQNKCLRTAVMSDAHTHTHTGLSRLQSRVRVTPRQTDAHAPAYFHTLPHTHTLTQALTLGELG